MVAGIKPEVWRDTEALKGFALTPALSGYTAEIVEIREGVSESSGNEYVQFCSQLEHPDIDQDSLQHWEYFELTEARLGFLKAFIEGVGRCDLFLDDAEWDDLKGTQFTCNIKHTTSKKTNQEYANIDLGSLEAISHDVFEMPKSSSDPKKKKETGRRASPRRSPRAGVAR
jgi:hypothetical protein